MPADKLLRNILIIAILQGLLLLAGVLLLVHPGVLKTVSDQAQDESIRVSRHLINLLRPQEQLRRQQPLSPEFIAQCHQARLDFNLVKIKFFDGDGLTIFSTDPADIGIRNLHAFFREQVMSGEIVAKTVQRHQPSLEKEKFPEHLVETYVPLMEQGRFLGAFEIYYDISDRFHHLQRLLILAFSALLFTVLVFWGGLLLALRRAGRNLTLLEEATGELAGRNQQLTEINEMQQRLLAQAADQQQREEELKRDEYLRSLGTLAGGIAHDFNNLLTGILGNISLARRVTEGKGGKEGLLPALDNAAMAGRHAAELVAQLLLFAKGGRNREQLIELAPLIRETVGVALADCPRVKPAFFFARDLAPISGDPSQLRQLLSNLIRNAREAMPEGGAIIIRAENLPTAAEGGAGEAPAAGVRITIEDEGAGIPAPDQERIFEPYFSGKPLDSHKGRGLGLAICRAVVKHHRGSITVSSAPGRGAIFTIDLPAA